MLKPALKQNPIAASDTARGSHRTGEPLRIA
jgi:hypothetical protein